MSAQGNSARNMEAAFARLSDKVRTEVVGEVSERVSLAGRERLLASLAKAQYASRPSMAKRIAWGGGAGALAAAAAVALMMHFRPMEQQHAWTADNAVAADDGYVSTAKPDASATLHFAAGASMELAGGSRGRVVDATRSRAKLVLEAGRAAVHTPHPQLSFVIQAGPYALVTDDAASFDVEWSGDSLDVHVKAGSVKVDGPSAQSLALRADQHLVTSVSDGGLRVDRTSSEGAAPAAPEIKGDVHGAADDTQLELPDSPQSAAHDSHEAKRPSQTWTQRVAAGEYETVLREADARGIDSSIRKGTLADVAALADAARYAGRTPVAKRAMAAERSRFPGSSEARTAAFLLGRIAEDADGNPQAAIGWYDRYLAEAPKGPLASEALGRKMLLVFRTSGADAAKPIAEQYLRRYPSGSYAVVARQYAGTSP